MARRCILVVEDDAEIRQALVDILEYSEYAVVTAPDGAAALAGLARWRPDAILLDMLMPELDGPAFLAALQERGDPSVPILLLSAMRDLPARAADLPVVGYVAKPFDVGELLDALAALWGEVHSPNVER